MVDTQGLVMKVVAHEAGLRDRKGAELLLGKLRGVFPRMAKVWADSAYRELKEWIQTELGCGIWRWFDIRGMAGCGCEMTRSRRLARWGLCRCLGDG